MISAIVERKYAMLISSTLKRFKVLSQSPFKASACCPICMDSRKNARKTRFYILEKDNGLYVFCHNCNFSSKFAYFLREQDPLSYRNYLLELFQDNPLPKQHLDPKATVSPVVTQNDILKGLTKISTLSDSHPAKKYVISRKIPSDKHYKLFYTSNFSKWIQPHLTNMTIPEQKLDPRLVLPLLDRKGNCFGVNARDLSGNSSLRYITIRFNESFPKVYGLEDFNPNYKTYIVEGPIDSLFLPNSLAMVGADIPWDDLVSVSNAIKDNIIKVRDNEKRNRETVQKIAKDIKDGFKVCIWPKSMKFKDVNEIILGNLDPLKLIEDNTVQGLEAMLKFANWRRV